MILEIREKWQLQTLPPIENAMNKQMPVLDRAKRANRTHDSARLGVGLSLK